MPFRAVIPPVSHLHFLLLLLLPSSLVLLARCGRPNIVMIVADDLGWGDVGFNDAFDQIRTPYIDSLAKHGVLLDNYYTAPMCTPSRWDSCVKPFMGRGTWQIKVRFG